MNLRGRQHIMVNCQQDNLKTVKFLKLSVSDNNNYPGKYRRSIQDAATEYSGVLKKGHAPYIFKNKN